MEKSSLLYYKYQGQTHLSHHQRQKLPPSPQQWDRYSSCRFHKLGHLASKCHTVKGPKSHHSEAKHPKTQSSYELDARASCPKPGQCNLMVASPHMGVRPRTHTPGCDLPILAGGHQSLPSPLPKRLHCRLNGGEQVSIGDGQSINRKKCDRFGRLVCFFISLDGHVSWHPAKVYLMSTFANTHTE